MQGTEQMSEIHLRCSVQKESQLIFISEVHDSMSGETVLFWNESYSVCVQPHSQYIRDKCMSGDRDSIILE